MDRDDRVDFIIFGASGFTGQYVVKDVLNLAKEDPSLTWKVAGRSEEKLTRVLKRFLQETCTQLPAGADIKSRIIVCDLDNDATLNGMAAQGKVVLNCVGPYRFYEEQVVKACVSQKTNYVDISGEPQFLEAMQHKYNDQARELGIYIVGACGFDSLPCDLGIEYVKRRFPGDLNSVETFLRLRAGPDGAAVHYATWESAVHGFANAGELRNIRKSVTESGQDVVLPKSSHCLRNRGTLHYNDDVGAWCVPFPGSDRSVVLRSQKLNYTLRQDRPLQMQAYIEMPSLFTSILLLIFGGLFTVLASFSLGRWLLLKYPRVFSYGFFSHDGPTPAQMAQTKFVMTFVAHGYNDDQRLPAEEQHVTTPNLKMVAQVSGPEPGYVATPIFIVESAYAILRSSGKIPVKGGVLTTAAAFANTNIIPRLQKQGVTFEVIENNSGSKTTLEGGGDAAGRFQPARDRKEM